MKLKLLFIASRIFFLASIVILQLVLAYKLNISEFAYVSFGFTILSIAMIAYTFGFNQFLMYQFSRESKTLLNELFSKLFRIYLFHIMVVSFLFFIALQFYTYNYLEYGLIFMLMGLLLSFRDYLNIPNIINRNYKEISISNVLVTIPIYLITLFILFSEKAIKSEYSMILLVILLSLSIGLYDFKKYFHILYKTYSHNQKNIFIEYQKTFTFGISVFLFTIYYQLSNILLPLLEGEDIVATFGVVFIYLGIIYTLLNIVFNQIILPNMYKIYKSDKSLYNSTLNKYKLIFTLCGIVLFIFSLLIENLSTLSVFHFIITKYPLLPEGISYMSFGILARYIATVYSGNMNVIGQISLKVKIQIIVTIISFILTYILIHKYSFIGACVAYSLTESFLLIGYIIGGFSVKKA